jgi:cytoskeletal protein RodZ
MLKQFLTGSFILAVFFANSGATEANSRATLLLSQAQTVPSTSATPDNANTSPNSDRAIPNRPLSNPAVEESPATPIPNDALTLPSANHAETRSESGACEDIPLARPTGGATRERLQALEQCYRTDK